MAFFDMWILFMQLDTSKWIEYIHIAIYLSCEWLSNEA